MNDRKISRLLFYIMGLLVGTLIGLENTPTIMIVILGFLAGLAASLIP